MPQARDQPAIAREDPGLWAAQQLVAAERDQTHTRAEAVRYQRFCDPEGAQVGHTAAAEVFIDRDIAFGAERYQLAQLRPGGESFDAEVAGMHAQQQARSFVDGLAIIFDTRPIGGPDLPQHCARALHNIWDAEAIADFDQLAARDDHLESCGQLVEAEINRRGVVVHRDARRAYQPLQ